MAEIRLTVDPSQPLAALRQVGDEMRKLSAVAAELRRASATALSGTGGASGQAAQHEQTTRAIEQQAKATQQLGQTQATQAAIADRVLRTRREETGLVQRIIDGLGSQDAATRKAAQSTATFLSTLGGASRAASQYAVAMSRIERALAAGLVTESQANLLREKTAKTFTTANINAKDLRLNMQGLNQSFQVLASVVGRFDPVLGAVVGTMVRAGRAAGNLSGGFALLGPLAGIIATVAAGFAALAVAGDRTASIPTHITRIWAGMKELAAQAGEASGATRVLIELLEKLENLLPTPQNAVQASRARIEQLKNEIAALPAATPSQATGRGAREFGVVDQNQRQRVALVKELTFAEGELATALAKVSQEGNQLALSYTEEGRAAAAKLERDKKIVELAQKGLPVEAVRAQVLQSNAQFEKDLDEIQKRRLDTASRLTAAQKEANKEAKEAAEIAKAYKDAIAGLRVEEEQATVNEQHRLEDLKANNDLLQQEIEATKQGTEALKAFNLEKARTLEIERQRKSGANLSSADSAALVSEAERQEQLRQQLADQSKLAKDTNQIWDNTIENIQRAWGDLWANVLGGGFKTFKDLTSSIKGLFTSLLGNLITGAFAPFFNQLKQGLSGAGGGQGAANIAGGNFEISKFLSGITSSVSSGFEKVLAIFTGGNVASQQTFTQRTGNTPLAPASGFQAPAGFNIGTAFADIAAGIGGVIAGIQLNNALTKATQYQLEKTLGKVGELLGGIVGGVFGAVFGGPGGAAAGGLIGSVAGGAILSGFGGIIGAKQAGKSINETATFKESFDRNIAISGDPITALVMSLLLRNRPDIGLQLRTLPRASDFPAVDLTPRPGQRPTGTLVKGTTAIEGPFGFIGAIGSGTGGDLVAGQVQSFVRSLALFDAAVANHLTRAEEAIVKGSGLLTDKTFSNTRNSEKIFKTRAEAVLQALGVPLQTGKDIFDAKNAQGKTQTNADIVQNLNDFLVARRQIQDLITDLRGLTLPTNNASKALDDIHQKMNQIRIAAPDLGIALADFAHLEEEAVAKFKAAFAGSIDDAIAAFVDPFSLAVRALDDAQAQRLREAITAESDLTKVARLNALERAKLLEQANAPLQQLIDQIQITPAGSSPLTALGGAESRFFTLAGTPGADRGDIAAAAQSFLGLGEQFLGGPTFSAKRDLVLSTLESLLLTLPGVSADTGEQLDGLNLETARGNAANEQLLANLITETSAMRNEIVLLNTKLERALAK